MSLDASDTSAAEYENDNQETGDIGEPVWESPVSNDSSDQTVDPADSVAVSQAEEPEPVANADATTVLDAFERHYGSRPEFETDSQLLDGLSESLNRANNAPSAEEIAQLRELQPTLAAYSANAADFQTWKSEREQAAAEKEVVAEDPKWQPPTVSEHVQRYIDAGFIKVDPQTGLYSTKDPNLQSLIPEANTHMTWQRDVSRRLVNDPMGVLKEAGLEHELTSLRETLRDEIRNEILGEFQNTRVQDSLEAELRSTQHLYLEMNGNELKVDTAGQPVFTERGRVYRETAERLKQLGVEDPRSLHDESTRMAMAMFPVPNESTPAQTGNDQNSESEVNTRKTQKQKTFVDRARRNGTHQPVNRLAQRDATVASAAARETAQKDMDEDSLWESSRKEAEIEIGVI